jgi:hypothetical protein
MMSFQQSFPIVAQLLGATNVAALDQHAIILAAATDAAARAHFSGCALAHWCALYTTPEYKDHLVEIEWALAKIVNAIGAHEVQNAYANKARNQNQFTQLLAEITTAATCAVNAQLLDLEWRTSKQNYDADVRAEISGEPVNLEVTLRTDGWVNHISFNTENYLDDQGNLIAPIPPAKSRRTMTDQQREDLKDSGIELPVRVSEVITTGKAASQPPAFISDPDDVPAEEGKPKAYCADGEEKRVESVSVQQCIQSKATKFNADGYHFVVLATTQSGFPSEHSVFDAVFGQTPQLKRHGVFESGLYDQIGGVIYLPVCEQLSGLKQSVNAQRLARLFPNHNATRKPADSLVDALAHVFDAGIRRGWNAHRSGSAP